MIVVRRARKGAIMNSRFDGLLPEGWFASTAEESATHYAELLRELAPGHPLYDVALDVVAHREGTDDILCRHHSEPDRLTVVHLTWRGHPEIAPRLPAIECDGTIQDLYDYERRFGSEC